jgi:hypothetical protein
MTRFSVRVFEGLSDADDWKVIQQQCTQIRPRHRKGQTNLAAPKLRQNPTTFRAQPVPAACDRREISGSKIATKRHKKHKSA